MHVLFGARAFLTAIIFVVVAAACSDSGSAGADISSNTSVAVATSSSLAPPSGSVSTSVEVTVPAPVTTTESAEVNALLTSPDGRFDYVGVGSSRDDDDVEMGRTILVDSGDGFGPAFNDSRDRFDDIGEIVFGPTGLISWISTDPHKGSMAFVGRIDAAGKIVDSHRVFDDQQVSAPIWFDDDGLLHASIGDDMATHDTSVDPFFVMSAVESPLIESDDPLILEIESEGFWAREIPGYWYRGETLGTDPGCGSSTLYKDDEDGYVRVLDAGIELDTIVDIDVGEAFNDGGLDSVGLGRVVVLSTACPGEYEGRRLFWGLERIDYGDGGPRFESPLHVVPVDDTLVADVLSVNPQITADGCCPQVTALLVEVERLDGTVATIEIPV